MRGMVTIANGFAEIGAGTWLAGRGQPVASFGEAVRRRRPGLCVHDRSALSLMETPGGAFFADSSRPFLTLVPCAAPVFAVSDKVLLAPAAARVGSELVKLVPMSLRHSFCVTQFEQPAEGGQKPAESASPTPEPQTAPAPQTGCAPAVQTAGAPAPQSAPAPAPQTGCAPAVQTAGVPTPQAAEFAFVVLATTSRTKRIVVAEGDTLSARPEAVVAWTGSRPTGFMSRIGVWDVLLPRRPRGLMLHFHGPCVVWLEGANLPTSKLSNFQAFNNRRNHGF